MRLLLAFLSCVHKELGSQQVSVSIFLFVVEISVRAIHATLIALYNTDKLRY